MGVDLNPPSVLGSPRRKRKGKKTGPQSQSLGEKGGKVHLPRLRGWETFSAGILVPLLSLVGGSGTRGWSPWPGDATTEGTGVAGPPRGAEKEENSQAMR